MAIGGNNAGCLSDAELPADPAKGVAAPLARIGLISGGLHSDGAFLALIERWHVATAAYPHSKRRHERALWGVSRQN